MEPRQILSGQGAKKGPQGCRSRQYSLAMLGRLEKYRRSYRNSGKNRSGKRRGREA